MPSFRAATDADLAFAARAASECVPHHPHTEEEMRLEWRLSEGMGAAPNWIVEGLGWFGLLLVQGGSGFGWIEVFVPGAGPELQAEVLAFGEARALDLGMTELVAEPWEDQHALLTALRARGYGQRRRERFWRLELAPSAARLRAWHTEALDRVRAAGADIVPAAALGGRDVYPSLFDIHNRSHEDIPRSVPFVPEPWEVWIGWMDAVVKPDGIWVALVGGQPAGYSYLAHNDGGRVETGYTGMLREHRGRGLARAMKLATLVQALDDGVAVVETDNDSENAPIIHLNQALGYSEITGKVEFAKKLE